MEANELRFSISEAVGDVSALVVRPAEAKWLLVLGHGAGAGMRHPFMEAMSRELNAVGMATFRYQSPYMERRSRRPDPPGVLTATARAAVAAAAKEVPDLPLLAGGKSMGGRMTSLAAAESPLAGVRGLVFFGFPLHPPGQPSTKRGEHLAKVDVPMLFLQGTRDNLAELELLRPVVHKLGERATLEAFDGADHSFHVLKSSGRNDAAVLRDLAERVIKWATRLS